ncbi:carboxypeptidase-like regulatory domain-containing protein [Bizionia saleffrena]|uniref:Carboxypeptidase-like regulatory domain-containing protein n=1 Tax=Bizionia saleffrena TaxID=291189 RepID=A0A8H2LJ73_9FLAO|nr:carboxypeptidase-like regulatory domain-containing protein [Bizionia saleffrena]TYB80232.1 carboxypeptidase-like regulatory domain-containing protein [Bizionia saleffrena]
MNFNHYFFLALLYVPFFGFSQNTSIISETQESVSFASISFGNGNGIFADDEGKFYFTKKLYSDIDTLYISALGYKDLKITTKNLPNTLVLESRIDKLQEVIVKNKPSGPFKIEEIKPTTHDDYYQCWLPTIESEIAVFFPNETQQTKRLTTLYLPIKVEAKSWRKRKRANAEKRSFSTLFRVQFYENNDGLPGDILTYDKVVFIATEDYEKIYELDIKKYDIFVPKSGVFVSIQVLGYTDDKGKLLPHKKYQEVKTTRGTVKVSTTFRPLLPFTNAIIKKQTYVKRVFLNGGKWVLYAKENIKNSNLLSSGLNNYGMGLEMEVYSKN